MAATAATAAAAAAAAAGTAGAVPYAWGSAPAQARVVTDPSYAVNAVRSPNASPQGGRAPGIMGNFNSGMGDLLLGRSGFGAAPGMVGMSMIAGGFPSAEGFQQDLDHELGGASGNTEHTPPDDSAGNDAKQEIKMK